MRENWTRAYREAPEVFDAFTRAEDPEGLIAGRLLAHASLSRGSVVEIGCGSGSLMSRIAPRTECYLGIDPEPRMLALARDRAGGVRSQVHLVQARAERLPIRTGVVDQLVAAWVLIGLPPRRLTRVLDEASRVLGTRPEAGLWVVESHWSGEFHDLRGPRRETERQRIQELVANRGFSCVEVLRTELRFPSAGEAERVLGYLCGSETGDRLRRSPRATLTHDVIILRRSAGHR